VKFEVSIAHCACPAALEIAWSALRATKACKVLATAIVREDGPRQEDLLCPVTNITRTLVVTCVCNKMERRIGEWVDTDTPIFRRYAGNDMKVALMSIPKTRIRPHALAARALRILGTRLAFQAASVPTSLRTSCVVEKPRCVCHLRTLAIADSDDRISRNAREQRRREELDLRILA
jgi:hypothetical protein